MEGLQLRRAFFEHGLVHDGVAPVDALGPVSDHLHGGGPRHARTLKVSDGSATEIIGNALGYPGLLHAVTHARRKDLIRTPEVSGSPLLAIPGFAAWAAETPSRFPDPIIWAPFNAQDLIASPKDAINVFDFEPIARKNVPPAHFGYMASGIDDEVTLRANREGFLKFQLRPRRLNDVSKRIGNMNALRRRLPRPRPRSP